MDPPVCATMRRSSRAVKTPVVELRTQTCPEVDDLKGVIRDIGLAIRYGGYVWL
jgi:hypothetical protein